MTNKGLVMDITAHPWDKSQGFELRDLPMPVLDEASNPADASSVIVKVRYAGICGSDLGLWYRKSFKDLFHESLEREGKTVRVNGHEFVGEIVEAGSLVESLYADPDPLNPVKIQVGSLVSGDSHVTCGRCYQCRIGEANVCLNEAILGISIDGIYANYVKVPAKNLWAVDETRVRPEIASMFDPFGNAVHACAKVDMRGQRVAIVGTGAIGMFSILLAKNYGAAKIIAIDVNPANLEMAKSLGADEVIQIEPKDKANPYDSDPEVVDRIMQLTYGKGVDIAMEMAGPFSSVNNCIDITRRGGDVILFGIQDGDLTIPKFSRTIVKGLTMHCVIGRQIFGTWQVAQRMLSQQKNGIQDAIWKIMLNEGRGSMISLDEFTPELFEKANRENPKVFFKISG